MRTGPDDDNNRKCIQDKVGERREEMLTKLCATLVAAVAAALLSAAPVRAAEAVKIGVLMPLTGNAAAAGQASKAAIEIAAEIVNGKHPELGNLPLAATEACPDLGGAKIELVFVDHQGNPSVAQQQALRLITQDKVQALLGAYQSSVHASPRPRSRSATAFRSWSAIPPR